MVGCDRYVINRLGSVYHFCITVYMETFFSANMGNIAIRQIFTEWKIVTMLL